MYVRIDQAKAHLIRIVMVIFDCVVKKWQCTIQIIVIVLISVIGKIGLSEKLRVFTDIMPLHIIIVILLSF